VTFPKIRATRHSAARCGRIDLVPSRRVAILWFAWVCIACLPILALQLPWQPRLALCLAIVAVNCRAISRLVLLRGTRAVRWIEWGPEGQLRIGAHTSGEGWDARLRPGSFRLGFAFLVLWFATPAGERGVVIDGCLQEPAAFRRLGRLVGRRSGPGSGPSAGGS
jgi:hypothetical protein